MSLKKSKITRLGIIAVLGANVLLLAACGSKARKVNYYIDGKKVEECPAQGRYELKSIKCNRKDANATWDNNTWSLSTDDIGKKITVDLNFIYTESPVTMNGIGYDTLQGAFDAAGTGPAEIHITKDISGSGVTHQGSDITLCFNGFTLEGSETDTIVNNGNMKILGNNGSIVTPSGDAKTLVNFGTMSVSDLTIESSADTFTVWNSNNKESSLRLTNCSITRTNIDVVPVINSGSMQLDHTTITGGGDLTHPALLQNDAGADLVMTGSTITNTGSGYSLYRESGTVNMDGESRAPNAYGLDAEG